MLYWREKDRVCAKNTQSPPLKPRPLALKSFSTHRKVPPICFKNPEGIKVVPLLRSSRCSFYLLVCVLKLCLMGRLSLRNSPGLKGSCSWHRPRTVTEIFSFQDYFFFGIWVDQIGGWEETKELPSPSDWVLCSYGSPYWQRCLNTLWSSFPRVGRSVMAKWLTSGQHV